MSSSFLVMDGKEEVLSMVDGIINEETHSFSNIRTDIMYAVENTPNI